MECTEPRETPPSLLLHRLYSSYPGWRYRIEAFPLFISLVYNKDVLSHFRPSFRIFIRTKDDTELCIRFYAFIPPHQHTSVLGGNKTFRSLHSSCHDASCLNPYYTSRIFFSFYHFSYTYLLKLLQQLLLLLL